MPAKERAYFKGRFTETSVTNKTPNNSGNYFRKIIKSWNALGWKGPSEVVKPNPPAVSRDIFNYTRLLRTPSNPAWNASRDGASAASLDNVCQCFTTLMVKKFFLLSSLNLPSLGLKPLLLVLSQQALLKIFSPSFL